MIEACLVMVNVPPQHWDARIDEQRRVIGRGATAQIRIPADFAHVSRRHAEVWADRRGLWIRDVGSRLGTRVNGLPIESGCDVRLVIGDRLMLGGLELLVSAVPPLAAPPVAAPPVAVPRAEPASDDDLTHPQPAWPPLPSSLTQQLSAAEQEIVRWMVRGYVEDDDLARVLFRSPHTVRTQIGSIFRKLGVNSRAALLGLLRRGEEGESSPGAPAPPPP